MKMVSIGSFDIRLLNPMELSYKKSILILLEAGADINSQLPDGTTSLMIATKGAEVNLVRVLLEKGANSKITNKEGRTALAIAEEEFKKSRNNPRISSYMPEVINLLKAH